MKWRAEDWIVFTLTFVIAVAVCSYFINQIIDRIVPSENTAKIISNILTAILTIISIYIGGKLNKK